MNLDLDTIETTFDLVAPRGEELMDVFYARLFAAAPAVKPLFAATDIRRQKAILLDELVLVRRSLHDMDALVSGLRSAGRVTSVAPPVGAAARLTGRRAARRQSCGVSRDGSGPGT
jgi:hypothetical protein